MIELVLRQGGTTPNGGLPHGISNLGRHADQAKAGCFSPVSPPLRQSLIHF
jgi:hypothetical protein